MSKRWLFSVISNGALLSAAQAQVAYDFVPNFLTPPPRNDFKGQSKTPDVKPADWRDNVVTSPHGVTFEGNGNILETEWSRFGRVLRWSRK